MANKFEVTEDPKGQVFVAARIENGKLMFPDNLTGTCTICNHPIQFRPDVNIKPGMMFACLDCMLPKMIEEAEKGELHIETNQASLDLFLEAQLRGKSN